MITAKMLFEANCLDHRRHTTASQYWYTPLNPEGGTSGLYTLSNAFKTEGDTTYIANANEHLTLIIEDVAIKIEGVSSKTASAHA